MDVDKKHFKEDLVGRIAYECVYVFMCTVHMGLDACQHQRQFVPIYKSWRSHKTQ